MPIFTFRVRGTSMTAVDREGAEYADLASAIEEARASAREIWADGIRIGIDRRRWFIDVVAANG